MDIHQKLVNQHTDNEIALYYLFHFCKNPEFLKYKDLFKSEPTTGLTALMNTTVLDIDKLNTFIIKRYKQTFEDCPEKFLSIIQFELMPKPNIPEYRSTIQDGILVKFDERDLDKNNNYTTPQIVTTIGPRAFESCKKIKNLIISEGVVEIQNLAFAACTNLESIQLPSSLKSLGAGTFFACKKLDNVVIPTQVTNLDFLLFCRCESLKTLTLHSQIKKIDKCSFTLCDNVTPINLPSKFKSNWDNDQFKQDASYSIVQIANSVLKKQGAEPLNIFR